MIGSIHDNYIGYVILYKTKGKTPWLSRRHRTQGLLRVWEARALRQSALLNFKLSCLEEKSAHVFAPVSSEQTSPPLEVRARGRTSRGGAWPTLNSVYFWCLIAYLFLSEIWPMGSWLVSAILNVGHLISFLFFFFLSSKHSMALFVWLPRFHAWTQSEIYILKRPYCSPFRRQLMSITSWDEGREGRERDRKEM